MARAFGASLLLLVLAGAGVAAAADIGHEDFTAAGDAVTGSKPESKLWYNDGKWWASMWSTAPTPGFFIYRLNTATETWTGRTTALDNRVRDPRRHPLGRDPAVRRVAERRARTAAAPGSGTNRETRLYRFSYNAGTDTYTLDGGFPASMRTEHPERDASSSPRTRPGCSGPRGPSQDGDVNQVYTNHTVGNDTTWSTPGGAARSLRPTSTIDDISSIIAFTVAGEHRIGVFWSNQDDDEDYFAWQVDGGADDDWTLETASAPATGNPHPADDHMNLKTDSSGRVYAVVKTSNMSGSQPLIQLLVRATGGAWSSHDVGTVTNSNTRAIVELDTDASMLHVFMTGRHNATDGQERRRHLREDGRRRPRTLHSRAGPARS